MSRSPVGPVVMAAALLSIAGTAYAILGHPSPAITKAAAHHEETPSFDVQHGLLGDTLFIDATKVPSAYSQNALEVLVDGRQVKTTSLRRFFVLNLPRGEHSVTVALEGPSRLLLQHQAQTFEVDVPAGVKVPAAAEPKLTVTPHFQDGQLILSCTVTHMRLTPRYGEPMLGEGHLAVYLDGTFVGPFATDTIAMPTMSPGVHTVTVAIHNRNHTTYGNPKDTQVTFNVTIP